MKSGHPNSAPTLTRITSTIESRPIDVVVADGETGRGSVRVGAVLTLDMTAVSGMGPHSSAGSTATSRLGITNPIDHRIDQSTLTIRDRTARRICHPRMVRLVQIQQPSTARDIGNVPPAEAEAAYDAALDQIAQAT